MKTCPVCEAVAFDDAAICYGCMHRFAETDVVEEFDAAGLPIASAKLDSDSLPDGVGMPDAAKRDAKTASGAQASDWPVFRIKFTPKREPQGVLSWTCTVEA